MALGSKLAAKGGGKLAPKPDLGLRSGRENFNIWWIRGFSLRLDPD